MRNTSFVALAIALSLVACKKEAPAPPPPPEVYVADVVQRDVPVYMEFVGQTRGFQDVEIRARVEGYLETVNFQEGTFVKKGTLLYRIDPKPLEATLARAKADLATCQARLAKSTNDVKRLQPLVTQQAVSQQELDNALAARDASAAQVQAAEAVVENATLDLGYTRIASPIDGIVGTTNVKAGNLVGRGESTLLTTVSVVDPILFRAGITEAEYLRLARRIETPGTPPRAAEVGNIELILADGTVHPHPGTLDAVERAIDSTTGTLAVQVRFVNPDRVLRPGQYGRMRARVDVKQAALLVPQRAVAELQNLYSVAVVEQGNKVAFRNVTVGPRVDNLWVIESGLNPGDKVVVEGLQRVKEGMVVNAQAAPASPPVGKAAEPVAPAGTAD